MKGTLERQKIFYDSGSTKDIKNRLKILKKFKKSIISNEKIILNALKKDLNKGETEAYITEIYLVLKELKYMIKNLKKMAKPEKVKADILNFNSKNYIYKEPYGNALVVGTWNYPFQLTMMPLVGAVAGGNTAIVKLPKYTKHTNIVMQKIIEETFVFEHVTHVEGGREVMEELLNLKFDKIFFTGSPKMGKIVMESASKNLASVSLELGGKSPVIVDESANLDEAAKKVLWAKVLNAGQTCIAPDYVLVHYRVKEMFMRKLIKYNEEFLNDITEYVSIISDDHFERLEKLINKNKTINRHFIDKDRRIMTPIILEGIDLEEPAMNEEIFGPILPILEYKTLKGAVHIIEKYEKPLSLYMFSNDKKSIDYVMNNVKFGGGAVNDLIMHMSNENLPFGGVGNSGIGSYHGKYSFEAFTHKKSVMFKKKKDNNFRYNITKKKMNLIKFISK
ncbi:MAG: aldehyde dehydrogenase family protein [Clostridia bacterium]|jgi:aldehyde dehydrogenase (NAD+)|nr:aldehyde dehydrogenase family protein [Clostridia bacterium]